MILTRVINFVKQKLYIDIFNAHKNNTSADLEVQHVQLNHYDGVLKVITEIPY